MDDTLKIGNFPAIFINSNLHVSKIFLVDYYLLNYNHYYVKKDRNKQLMRI